MRKFAGNLEIVTNCRSRVNPHLRNIKREFNAIYASGDNHSSSATNTVVPFSSCFAPAARENYPYANAIAKPHGGLAAPCR